jgi:hypothetical protein
MQRTKEVCVELTAVLLPSAENELAAFAGAVQELFGAEQVRQSIDDWMDELGTMDGWRQGAMPDWRAITIAAAVRLASRVNVLPQGKGRMSAQANGMVNSTES